MEVQHERQKKQRTFKYEVSYTAVSPGPRKLYNIGDTSSSYILHILRTREYAHSFTMCVCRDPTQLAHPVRVVTDLRLDHPYGIVFNSRGEMIVRGVGSQHMTIFDITWQRIGSIPNPFGINSYPGGITIDDMDNIYMTNRYGFLKLSRDGKLMKKVERDSLKSVTIYDNKAYVCGRSHIEVYDLNLNLIRYIYPPEYEAFGKLNDVKFDADGNMYIAETEGERVQVLDKEGHFLRVFGEDLYEPTALHVVGKYVYVCHLSAHTIVVYKTSGQFVTSFGKWGSNEGEFRFPCFITSCADGLIYVCDSWNGRVQIF